MMYLSHLTKALGDKLPSGGDEAILRLSIRDFPSTLSHRGKPPVGELIRDVIVQG